MFRIQFFTIGVVTAFVCIAFTNQASARQYNTITIEHYTADYGVHPYDRADRQPGYRTRRRTSRSAQDNAYYRRTETHALHPYYRTHYYDTFSTQNTYPYGYGQPATLCQEYSFYKAKNRLPPRDFRCIQP